MTAPAFGDFTLPVRFRLAGALAVSFALAPLVAPTYGDWSASPSLSVMSATIFGEIFFGALLGISARILASALNVAGQIIAFQMGLSLAQIFDPSQELQGAIVGGFLAILGTTMIFATDLHLVMLAALRDSYFLLPPGETPDIAYASSMMTQTLSEAFSLGLRLSAPFILFGLTFYVGAGILNRLMPQAQVFFMLMPANLALGLLLLMLTTSLIMVAFLERFEELIRQFMV